MDLGFFNYQRRRDVAIILGAGASRGASFVSPHSLCKPPLDVDFFRVLRSSGLYADADSGWLLDFVEREFGTLDVRMESFYSQALLHNQFVADVPRGKGRRRRYESALRRFRRVLPRLFSMAFEDQTCTFHTRLASAASTGDSFISFNYDCLMDRAVADFSGRKWDPATGYGFAVTSGTTEWKKHEGRGRPPAQSIRLLKPHGSFNWKKTRRGTIALRTSAYEDREEEDLVIVPPLWQKVFEEDPYQQIWSQIRGVLSSVKALFVIGYSLPETDVYTQAALRMDIGTLDFLCIANPDPEARQRILNILRSGVTTSTHVLEFSSLADVTAHLPVA